MIVTSIELKHPSGDISDPTKLNSGSLTLELTNNVWGHFDDSDDPKPLTADDLYGFYVESSRNPLIVWRSVSTDREDIHVYPSGNWPRLIIHTRTGTDAPTDTPPAMPRRAHTPQQPLDNF